MSLINDALKKARLEAARHEAARRGVPLPQIAHEPARRAGRGPLLALGGLALALALGVALFTAGRRSAAVGPAGDGEAAVPAPVEEAAGAQTASTAPALAAPAAEAAARAVPRTGDARAAPSPPAGSPQAAEARTANPPAAPPPAAATSSSAAAAVEPAPPAPPARPRPPAREPLPTPEIRIAREPTPAAPARTATGSAPAREPRPAEAKPTYVREVQLPGGAGRLELGGIAWSEDRPFALINGRVVGPGDQIEAFMVVGVEPKRVELRGESGSFYLQLK